MKLDRKILILILGLLVFLPLRAEAKGDLKIYVNDRLIESDVKPYIKEGRTMVPLRFISEAFGLEVTWGQEWDEISERNYIYALAKAPNGREVYITEHIINSSDGIQFLFEKVFFEDVVFNEIKDGRFFLGLRYLSNALHFDIDWDQETNSVYLRENKDREVIPFYVHNYEGEKARLEKFDLEWRDGFYRIKGKDLRYSDLPIISSFRGERFKKMNEENPYKYWDYLESLNPNYGVFNQGPQEIERELPNNIYMDVDRRYVLGVNAG